MCGSLVSALNGCGSGGGHGGSSDGGGVQLAQSYAAVDILDLDSGYMIDGYNNAGYDVTFEYYKGDYDYYSGSGHWYSHFSINADRINMFDETSTGGSYRIDTYNNLLEVNEVYSIDFLNDEIIVDAITEDLDCSHIKFFFILVTP